MEGVFSAIMTVVNPGDEVICFSPTFMFHFKIVYMAEATPVFVNLVEDEGWSLDIEAVKKAITNKTKAIIITTPSNPTGCNFKEKNLRELGKLVLKHNLVLITDDPY